MNRTRSSVSAGTALLSVLLALVNVSPAVGGTEEHPRVRVRQVDTPVTIPDGTPPQTIAELEVGGGRWVAWAKLTATRSGSSGEHTVTCHLVVGGHPLADIHEGQVTIVNARPEILSLSVSRDVPAGGGEIRLQCAAGESTGADGSTVKARRIKIMAMRLERLRRFGLSTGSDVVIGSGNPNLVHAVDSGSIPLEPIPADTSPPATIATVPLGAGKWWIRASLTHRSGSLGSRYACTMRGDTVVGRLGRQDRTMVVLDVAVDVADAFDLKLRCGERGGISSQVVASGIRITALRVGRLTTGVADLSWDAATTGTGVARVYHGRRPIVGLEQGPSFGTVGVVPLPAGMWLLMGKLVTSDGEKGTITCRLRVGNTYDQTWDHDPELGRSLAFQLTRTVSRPTQARLLCHQSFVTGEQLRIRYARITLVLLSAINVAD